MIFLANTADRKNILFMLTDFDPRKWLAIFLTSEEIRRLSKSSVDTRSLFTEAGREIYRLCEKENKKISEKKITLKDISTEDLPDEGVFIGNKEELAIEDNFTTEDITGFKKRNSIVFDSLSVETENSIYITMGTKTHLSTKMSENDVLFSRYSIPETVEANNMRVEKLGSYKFLDSAKKYIWHDLEIKSYSSQVLGISLNDKGVIMGIAA